MTRDEFWQLVERSKRGADLDAQLEALEESLASIAPGDIADFDRHLHTLMLSEAYGWELWGAAYLINGGCSDDGFDYFLGWLVAQGRKRFESAMKNPDSLATLPGLEDSAELEDIWYVANRAYENKTGNRIPDDVVGSVTRRELGEGWNFDDGDEMESRYPKLFAKFNS